MATSMVRSFLVLMVGIGVGTLVWANVAARRQQAPNRGVASKLENEFLPEEKEGLRNILYPALGSMKDDRELDKVKKILLHLADVTKRGYHHFDATKEGYRGAVIYRHMVQGNIGYMCNGHAAVFLAILGVYDVDARLIIGQSVDATHPLYHEHIRKGIYGSHSTVEVRIDSRWMLADPTFFTLPKHKGKYVSLKDALETLCKKPDTQFEFENVSERYPVKNYYRGRSTSEYFRDLMFARAVAYKPFHRYPYDDAYRCRVESEHGVDEKHFTLGDSITMDTLTPSVVPASVLRPLPPQY